MSPNRSSPDEREPQLRGGPALSLRHWGGFVLAGGTAFVVDSGVLLILTRLVGVPALAARLAAISIAMVVSWLINRTLTFTARTPPTLSEFARFAAVGWSAAALNYVVFAVLILLAPGIHPVLAVAVASICAMGLSYTGMKFGVFRQ